MTSRTPRRAKSSNHGWRQASDPTRGRGLSGRPPRQRSRQGALLNQGHPSPQSSLADAHDDDEKLLYHHHLYIPIPILSLSFFSFTGYPRQRNDQNAMRCDAIRDWCWPLKRCDFIIIVIVLLSAGSIYIILRVFTSGEGRELFFCRGSNLFHVSFSLVFSFVISSAVLFSSRRCHLCPDGRDGGRRCVEVFA